MKIIVCCNIFFIYKVRGDDLPFKNYFFKSFSSLSGIGVSFWLGSSELVFNRKK